MPAFHTDPVLIGLGLLYISAGATLIGLVLIGPTTLRLITKAASTLVGTFAIALGVLLALAGFNVFN